MIVAQRALPERLTVNDSLADLFDAPSSDWFEDPFRDWFEDLFAPRTDYVYVVGGRLQVDGLRVRKIGITRVRGPVQESRRISEHRRQGFSLLRYWQVPSTAVARRAERSVLSFMRKCGMEAVDDIHMPYGGATETFWHHEIEQDFLNALIENAVKISERQWRLQAAAKEGVRYRRTLGDSVADAGGSV
ncbi:hypothetical protein G5C51_04465 [Streptomyces sp. A7024]|uniref:Uncharacterized protein n=1 Tax=Streptomyces coryli TaxID=1128680 RepID=A0A6G4TVY5_9ACTN|nr:hypothetical protein [Streptomyces coryli]NGN63161.1 hypothetical protein [Streptomyces coryli]